MDFLLVTYIILGVLGILGIIWVLTTDTLEDADK